ncbi:F-box protein At2g39490 [Jatropha curcas]|nr:F-box protein At2g39490 [Jatropha curcas]
MEDFISNLPNEILFYIISSLPFESAKQTIFLSERWRLLWKTALVQHGTEENFVTTICNFLANFNEQDPLKNTRKFQFHFINGNISLAIVAPNNELHLDFSTGKKEFDRQFKLQLDFNNNLAGRPSLSTIRSLNLISVNHLTNKAVSLILSKFQSLETLKIRNCNCLQSLSIGSDTKLLSFTIFDCPQLEFLTVRCFKLKTFRFRGLLPSIWLDYHYNLVDAFLDFRQGPMRSSFTNQDLDSVLLTIKNVKVLTVCKWTFKTFICPWLSTFLAEFQFYGLKELWWIDNLNQEYDSQALMSFLKLCPSLERLFVTIDPKSYCVEKITSCSTEVAGRNTKLKHLKLVKLDGFVNQEDEILLAQHLGEIVTTEPLILASAVGISLRKLINDPFYQQKQKRKSNYIFVEVKDMNQLCLKHVHMVL